MGEEHPMIGRIVAEDYKVVSFLGQGGMGSVFSAIQLSLNRQVAVKVLPINNIHPKDLFRFEQEINSMAAISHPNIVMIHHRGKFGDPPNLYYIMEMMEGGSLRTYLKNKKRFPVAKAIRLIRQVTEALSYAHDQGYIHRDIKPDNLLFNKNYGSLKVADFGIAKLRGGPNITQTDAIMGTLVYAAPEQLNWFEDWEPGQTGFPGIDERADQYSLGIVLYEMISGVLPYRANNLISLMKAMSGPPVPLAQSMKQEISASLEWLVNTMTAKSMEQRFSSDEALIAALDSVELEIATSVSGRVFAVRHSESVSFPLPPVNYDGTSAEEKAYIQNLQTVEGERADRTEKEVLDRYKKVLYWVIGIFTGLLFAIIFFDVFFHEETSLEPDKTNLTNTQNPPLKRENVNLQLGLTYDYPLPKDYSLPRVVLKTSDNKKISLNENTSVYPGTYRVLARLPGYVCQENNMQMDIPVDLKEVPFLVNFIARPRKIHSKIMNSATGKWEAPISFLVNNAELNESSVYRPGKHKLKVRFKNYQKIEEEILIPPGNETWQIKFPLQPLKEILFTLDYFSLKLQNHDYALEILVDDEDLPSYNYQYKLQKYRLHGFMQIPPEAKTILLRFGYYYAQIQVNQIYLLNDLNAIDIDRLLFHLASIDSSSDLLEQIRLLWESDREKLEKISDEDKTKLYRFLVSIMSDAPDAKEPVWKLRWLLNKTEALQAKDFYVLAQKRPNQSGILKEWQTFLEKYPQSIFLDKVEKNMEYTQFVAAYEKILIQTVRDCYLSLSEKRAIYNFQKRLQRTDIIAVRAKIEKYVKNLKCGKNLKEMLSER